MFRQEREILFPLAQGGKMDGNDCEPVVEILAEPAFPDAGRQILVGGSDQPDIQGEALVASHRAHGSVLDRSEQFGLEFRCHVADLVEKQRTAIGFPKLAPPASHRPGEGPFHMPEEFALEESRRHGGAVDRDEGPFCRRLLKCSALATNSFPVPLSPVIRTLTLLGAACRMREKTVCMAGLAPSRLSNRYRSLTSSRSRRFSSRSRRASRPFVRRRLISSRANGLVR